MTEAEELELLRLRKQKALASQAVAAPVEAPIRAPTPKDGLFDKLARGARYTLDSTNRAATNWLQGTTGALGMPGHAIFPRAFAVADEAREMLNATSPRLYEDRVRDYQRQWNQDVDPTAAAFAAAPVSMATGAAFPVLNSFPAVVGSNLLGAANEQDRKGVSLASSKGIKNTLIDAAVSTAIPYGLQGLGKLGVGVGGRILEEAAPALKTLKDMMRGGYIKPTPEAQRLTQEGLSLTLGHSDPGSVFARFEEIAANSAPGAELTRQRAGVGAEALNLLLKKATAPGMEPPDAGAAVKDQVKALRAGFDQLYDEALGGVRLQPELYKGKGKWVGLFADETVTGAAKSKGAFEKAVEVPDASDSVKARALEKLKDLASRNSLTPRKSGAEVGTVEARAIQALRRDIRTLKRKYAGGTGDEAPQFEEIYKRAEDFTTELLEGQLPPEAAAKLRTADSHFRDLLAVEDASSGKIAHRNGGEFTHDDLLDAIWRLDGVSPALDRAARDVRAVLKPNYPKTGALTGAASSLLEGKFALPLWARMANASPRLRAHALGQGSAPWWVKTPDLLTDLASGAAVPFENASPAASGTTLRALLEMMNQQQPAPAMAGDGEQPPPWMANR